ncbi:MAG: LamG-like jellyroll fold domain-containing protein, partial [Dehalococcoidia bacterium]
MPAVARLVTYSLVIILSLLSLNLADNHREVAAAGGNGQLIFHSGWEPSSEVELDSKGNEVRMIGEDHSVSGPSDWLSSMQSHPNISAFNFSFVCGDRKIRKADIVDDPTGVLNSTTGDTNQVMHFWLRDTCRKGASTRVSTAINSDRTSTDTRLKEGFQRVRMYYHPDFLTLKQYSRNVNWIQFQEFWIRPNWTGQPDPFRISFYTPFVKNAGKFYWKVIGEECCRTKQGFWQRMNTSVEVPIGEWFTAETYYKMGDKDSGRITFSIQRDGGPKQVIFDVTDYTYHPNRGPEGIYHWNNHKLYVNPRVVDFVRKKGGILQMYWDDWEVWDSIPPETTEPVNEAPQVAAGPDQSVTMSSPAVVDLDGTVTDDGLPNPPASFTTQWTATGPGSVTIGDASAVHTTASFTVAGQYTLTLSADDGEKTSSDSLTVTVNSPPELKSIQITPSSATVEPDASLQFSAVGLDQFGNPFPIIPSWSVSGGGSIDQAGLFSAGPNEGGPFTVTAAQDGVSGFASVSVVVINDLVGHWSFDESSGSTANDSSGSANHGQLSNGATLGQPGTLGNAVSFPFSGQVQVGTADWDNNHGTVALWAKANGFASGDQYFFGHTTQPAWANRIQLYTNDASGLLDLGLGNSHSRHLAIADLTANTWHHIALTWQGANGSGTYHVFVDGQDLASGSYSGLDSLQSLAHVGNDGDTGTRPFNGLMDDARVYNRALSPQEVVDLMADDTPAPNQPPAVNAGPDQSATLNGPVALALDGTVTDDGLPNPPGAVSTLWSASGPAP